MGAKSPEGGEETPGSGSQASPGSTGSVRGGSQRKCSSLKECTEPTYALRVANDWRVVFQLDPASLRVQRVLHRGESYTKKARILQDTEESEGPLTPATAADERQRAWGLASHIVG